MNASRESFLSAPKLQIAILFIGFSACAMNAFAETTIAKKETLKSQAIGFSQKNEAACDVSLSHKQSPTLSLPNQSINGTYVLKLDDSNLKSDSIELHRNFNGGEFELVQTLPKFSAISESVSQSGEYGYRVKYVCGEGKSKVVISESETTYIMVNLNIDSGLLVSAYQ